MSEAVSAAIKIEIPLTKRTAAFISCETERKIMEIKGATLLYTLVLVKP